MADTQLSLALYIPQRKALGAQAQSGAEHRQGVDESDMEDGLSHPT